VFRRTSQQLTSLKHGPMNTSLLLSIFQPGSNCFIVANTFIATSPLLSDAILIRNVADKPYRKLNDDADPSTTLLRVLCAEYLAQ
jgi:hypothetical protein